MRIQRLQIILFLNLMVLGTHGQVSKSEIQLFNGKNFSGWYTFIKGRGKNIDPKKVFSIRGNNLVISGEEFGCVTTIDTFSNYTLTVEWKWGGKTFAPRKSRARDSGILLNSIGSDGGSDSTWMYSIECQIIEGGTGDILVVGDGSENFSASTTAAGIKQAGSYVFDPRGDTITINQGRINWRYRSPRWTDVKSFRGSNDYENAVGKWNLLECVVRGSDISCFLNGKLVNHAFHVRPVSGKIQIQSEGAEIIFRRIELKRD